jgi:hypothetical protein
LMGIMSNVMDGAMWGGTDNLPHKPTSGSGQQVSNGLQS